MIPNRWVKYFAYAKCEITAPRLWNFLLRRKWNKIHPSPQRFHAPSGAFHIAKQYFTHPKGGFRWKKHFFGSAFFWSEWRDLNPRLTEKNIVALLAGSASHCSLFFSSSASLHLPQAARCSEPVNNGCDANIKQCHSIPCSVEPWFFPYNAINKRFAWCEKSLNNNGVRQLLDGLLAVVLKYCGVE